MALRIIKRLENMETKTVDLSGIDVVKAANDGAPIEINHPVTGDPLGISIQILGRDSDEFKRVTSEQNRRRLKTMTKTGVFKVDAVPQAEIDKDGLMALVAVTKGWTPAIVIDKGEEPSEYSRENCIKLYTRHPYIKEQVDAGVHERANFSKG